MNKVTDWIATVVAWVILLPPRAGAMVAETLEKIVDKVAAEIRRFYGN